eukprot:g8159.t1
MNHLLFAAKKCEQLFPDEKASTGKDAKETGVANSNAPLGRELMALVKDGDIKASEARKLLVTQPTLSYINRPTFHYNGSQWCKGKVTSFFVENLVGRTVFLAPQSIGRVTHENEDGTYVILVNSKEERILLQNLFQYLTESVVVTYRIAYERGGTDYFDSTSQTLQKLLKPLKKGDGVVVQFEGEAEPCVGIINYRAVEYQTGKRTWVYSISRLRKHKRQKRVYVKDTQKKFEYCRLYDLCPSFEV